jgi:predicted acetyltransferase
MGSHPTGVSIESIRPGDEVQRHRLRRQAFGGTDPHDPEAPTLPADQIVCAYDGDRLVGGVVTLDFAMTWGGRAVPCGGVSGVVVGAEARGRGAARSMLQESLRRMADRGQVISALYPTTAELYRSVGFEVAAWFARRRIPLAAVPTGPADTVEWRAVGFDDPALQAVDADMVLLHDGWFRPDPTWMRGHAHRWSKDERTNRFAYVAHRGGRDVAALVYRYSPADPFYELDVEQLSAVDGDALAAGLGFLAANGTTATELRTTLPASLLALHVPHVQRGAVLSDWPLMLRIVDAPGAIAARGWPTSVTGRVELSVVDPTCPGNDGPWVLEVDGGAAVLEPGGSGRVGLTIQDLAMVYAGADVRALAGAGRLRGASATDLDVLGAACASSPTIPYFF